MKKVLSLAILAIALLSSCASSSATKAAERVCSLRTDVRDDAVDVRAVIITRFDSFDAETQAKLRRLDEALRELDAIGAAACAFRGFDVSRAIDLVVEGVALAAELKAKGVI